MTPDRVLPAPAPKDWARDLAGKVADAEPFFVAPAIGVLMFWDRFQGEVIAFALVWLASSWLTRRVATGSWTVSTAADVPLVFMLAMVPASLLASADLETSRPVLYLLIAQVATLYAALNWLRTRRRIQLAAIGFVIAGLGIAALALIGTDWTGPKWFPLEGLYSHLPRKLVTALNPAGFSPNLAGGMLALLVPLAAAPLLERPRLARALPAALVTFTLVAVVALLQSRGAVIGIAAAFLVMGILRDRRLVLLIPLALVLVAWALYMNGVEAALAFIAGPNSPELSSGRFEVWQRAVYMLQDFPITGVGLGMFGRVANVLYPFFAIGASGNVPHAHNLFLQAGLDFGIPGMVAYLGLWTALLTAGAKTILATRGGLYQTLALGLFGGLIVILVHGMFDAITAVSLKAGVLVWGYFGLLLGAARILPEPSETAGKAIVGLAGRGHGETLRRWGYSFLIWVLLSLLSIEVIVAQPFWGLTVVIFSGLVLGLQTMLAHKKSSRDGVKASERGID